MKMIIGPAAEGEFYFARPYLNERFWKKLKESHHLSIAAPRRVGKSSFMISLLKNDKEGYRCIYIITESINEPNEFFKKVYKTLLGTLNHGGKFKQFFEDVFKRLQITKISMTEIEFGRNEIDYYEEILLLCREVKESDERIVLMIDEFSQTLENIIMDQGREVARNFLHQCRELRQDLNVKSKISFVYTGSIGLENLVLSIDEPRSITDIGHFSIPPFSSKEANDLITQIVDGDPILFEKEERMYFLEKMNWLLPYFIQVMMGEIESICKEEENQKITRGIIDLAFERALGNRSYFEHWLTRLRSIFKGFDFSFAKEVLNKAAVNKGIDYFELEDTIVKFNINDAAPLVNILQHDGYFVKDEPNRIYRFNSPLLQAWWIRNVVI
ncbi:ATP-binding protein [Chitinophaga niabensis]|uniref:ATPase n=1 Tax=Chitinophaga niabensis TaxID=536979 RepID=A0A1N6D6F6_9BACT|nr:AAA-like domain-containing protein [Chitinophaga niabensis]SIN66276.1 ATPase [Chitinophaga niabensis]